MIRARVLRAVVVGLLLSPAGGAGQEAGHDTELWRTTIPETAEEHLRLAKEYRQRAGQLRLDAKLHREMKSAYGRGVAQAPKGTAKPWWAKQQAHCERLAGQAETLGAEMERLAEFHTERAQEVDKPRR